MISLEHCTHRSSCLIITEKGRVHPPPPSTKEREFLDWIWAEVLSSVARTGWFDRQRQLKLLPMDLSLISTTDWLNPKSWSFIIPLHSFCVVNCSCGCFQGFSPFPRPSPVLQSVTHPSGNGRSVLVHSYCHILLPITQLSLFLNVSVQPLLSPSSSLFHMGGKARGSPGHVMVQVFVYVETGSSLLPSDGSHLLG